MIPSRSSFFSKRKAPMLIKILTQPRFPVMRNRMKTKKKQKSDVDQNNVTEAFFSKQSQKVCLFFL
jgi:hypothetical protein